MVSKFTRVVTPSAEITNDAFALTPRVMRRATFFEFASTCSRCLRLTMNSSFCTRAIDLVLVRYFLPGIKDADKNCFGQPCFNGKKRAHNICALKEEKVQW